MAMKPDRCPFGMRLTHPSRFFLLTLLCLVVCACSVSGQRSAYPPPDTLRMAEPQRHEFVQLVLQGRWCEAGSLFEQSMENYLLQDDFCAAAQNHLLAWKLKKYINVSDEQHLEDARLLLRTGLDCPGLAMPGADDGLPDNLAPRDRAYRTLIHQERFDALASLLQTEKDQLYASVYGRKAAQAAVRSGNTAQAEALLHQTRQLDARQGWIVFLIQDWQMLHALTRDPEESNAMRQRIERLQALIQPCPL